MHGGVGTNSMASAFLREYGLSFECRNKFKAGLERLACEKVDLVLGNHPEQSNTLEKMLKVESGGDILDANEWRAFLSRRARIIEDLIKSDPENP